MNIIDDILSGDAHKRLVGSKNNGLAKCKTRKMRGCLRCRDKFVSASPGHRICSQCSERNIRHVDRPVYTFIQDESMKH